MRHQAPPVVLSVLSVQIEQSKQIVHVLPAPDKLDPDVHLDWRPRDWHLLTTEKKFPRPLHQIPKMFFVTFDPDK
jgi:hypothetical protein